MAEDRDRGLEECMKLCELKQEMETFQTTVSIRNLREGVRYSVQIIPRLYTGDYDFESRELFEFKTDRMSELKRKLQ